MSDEPESWRCQSCHGLIYNVEWDGDNAVPVEGAPAANFVSDEYPRICTLCSQLFQIVNTTYFQSLEEQKRLRLEEYRRNFK